MKYLIFFRKVYKFHGIGIFTDDPIEKNSISFIFTNLKLRFEPCFFNLI
jgi:hypothetical protein